MSFTTDVLCIGAGYVGGPTMAVIADKCPHVKVTVVDINAARIDAWNSDQLPIYEPGLDEVVKRARGRNLFFSTDVASGHPGGGHHLRLGQHADEDVRRRRRTRRRPAVLGEDGARDPGHSDRDKIVVEKSTLPVRTAEAMERILNANAEGSTSRCCRIPSSWPRAPPSRTSSAPTGS